MDVPMLAVALAAFLMGLVVLGLVADWLDTTTERRDANRRNHARRQR